MSMIGSYLRISPDQLTALINEPALAAELAYPDDGEFPEPPVSFDLDKSWHLIHFLLTGEAWGGEGPFAMAVLGGEALADTDAGYGPFRYLRPDEVRATANALNSIDASTLWSRFDADRAKAAEIYPGWTGEDLDRQYVCHHYEALRQFYNATCSDGGALLLYIC
ncbi:MAG: YfbM family protein [Pseudomonadota bacterium]